MDIFYNIKTLSFTKKIELINEAKKLSYEWRVDKLDCSISWARQRIVMSFEDIMKKFDSQCHFVVILRDMSFINQKNYGEIVFSTMIGIDYFLWINITEENLLKLVEKYKLKKLG